jgi:hypothetical protein
MPDNHLLGWRKTAGKWSIDTDGRLVGDARADGLMLVTDNKLGTRYEILGSADFVSPSREKDNLGIYFGRETGDMRSSFTLDRTEQSAAIISSGTPVEKKDCTFGDSNSFQVQRWDARLSVTLNDKPLFAGTAIENFGNPAGEVLGLGGKYWYQGSSIRFSKLEVRKLNDEPAAMLEADKAESGKAIQRR